MKIHQNIFVISILILFSISSTFAAEKCHPDDKKALFQILKSFNNASLTPADPDCCGWYMVECDDHTNRVIKLFVGYDDEAAGRIPDAVGDLPYLEYLTFHKLPKLTGPIPQAVTKLKNLKSLSISYTNITGPIPGFLSKLTKLEDIILSVNKLTGSIPPSLANLPNLGGIFVERNLLTGPIPDSFGQFKNNPDFYLRLAKNQLNGPIPKSIGEVNFTELDISRNNLTGDASVFFGRNKGLQRINLSRNKFMFDMSKLEFPKSLNLLELSHNKIYGSLPKSLTKIPHLQEFNVSYNQLCGQIPKGGELNRFDKYSFVHNKCLCGVPLPPCK